MRFSLSVFYFRLSDFGRVKIQRFLLAGLLIPQLLLGATGAGSDEKPSPPGPYWPYHELFQTTNHLIEDYYIKEVDPQIPALGAIRAILRKAYAVKKEKGKATDKSNKPGQKQSKKIENDSGLIQELESHECWQGKLEGAYQIKSPLGKSADQTQYLLLNFQGKFGKENWSENCELEEIRFSGRDIPREVWRSAVFGQEMVRFDLRGDLENHSMIVLNQPSGVQPLFYYFYRQVRQRTAAAKPPVSDEELMKAAITGLFGYLKDPYSRFMDEGSFRELSIGTKGNFGGVGIEIIFRDGEIEIVTPIEGTPAMEAGIQPGDKIIEIEGKPVSKMKFQEAFQLLRGRPGEGLRILVERAGEKEPLDFFLIRKIIKLQVVKSTYIQKTATGYVRLKQFSANARDDIRQAVRKMKKDHPEMKALLLDLRWNPGGLLQSARAIADLFLTKGRTIVSTKGRDKRRNRVFKSTNRATLDSETPLFVLVNGGSASAAEILSGALQENNRAVILGQKTFGKGSVQTVLPLKYNTGLALTIQYYYTPLDRLIHGRGIEPDVKLEKTFLKASENEDLREIRKKKIWEKYYEKNPGVKGNILDRLNWLKHLRGKGYKKIRPKTAAWLMKKKLSPGVDGLIDLEFDEPLARAVDYIKKEMKQKAEEGQGGP